MPNDAYGVPIPDGTNGSRTYHVRVSTEVEMIMRVGASDEPQARAEALAAFMQKRIGGNMKDKKAFKSEVVTLDQIKQEGAEKRAKVAAALKAQEEQKLIAQKEQEEANELNITEV